MHKKTKIKNKNVDSLHNSAEIQFKDLNINRVSVKKESKEKQIGGSKVSYWHLSCVDWFTKWPHALGKHAKNKQKI